MPHPPGPGAPGRPDDPAHRLPSASAASGGTDDSGPPDGRDVQAVVVGVNESGTARAAIVLAAREARYRHAPLIAVRAYSSEQAAAVRPATLHTEEDERLDAELRLRELVREVLGEQGASVEVRAVLGLAGRKIVEIAHKVNAQLIVLATHGSTSLLLGTVSQYVLRKATCPVLVVPAAHAAAAPA